MGRLDEAAKRKVVELREAGLSFRKIKAVLELENIKVSAQAIYLFLKEFNGRTRPKDSTSGNMAPPAPPGSVPQRDAGIGDSRPSVWSEQQLRSLLRDASRVTGYPSPPASTGQSGVPSDSRGQSSGTGAASHGQQDTDGKDEDVRIVSVTSLAPNVQHGGVHAARPAINSGTVTGAFSRRRYTPSPANPVLVARKRILDKALFHRARVRDSGPQSGQPAVSLLRRDQSCFSAAEGRKVVLPQTATYDLTTTRPPHVRGLHPGASPFRRGFQQRANIPTRSPQQPPRIGIQLPTPSQPSGVPQTASSTIRTQVPTSQASPPSQQSSLDAGLISGLQEQVKSLASEVRSLGLALRIMVEQQGRLEREQSQQTQVQKQILSTLQELASKVGPCSLQHTTTPTVPSCPLSSTSYSQSTLTSGQGSYTSCSQAQVQSRYSEIEGSGLENIEAFSLGGLSPAAMNGFPQSGTSDTLSFTPTHTPAFTQSHTQNYTPSYTQSHTETYARMESKPGEMASTSSDGSFQACSASAQSSAQTISPHDAQLTIIKVENV